MHSITHSLANLAFAIEIVTFVVDFIPLAVESGAFAVNFVPLQWFFFALTLEFVAYVELGTFALEFVKFA